MASFTLSSEGGCGVLDDDKTLLELVLDDLVVLRPADVCETAKQPHNTKNRQQLDMSRRGVHTQ